MSTQKISHEKEIAEIWKLFRESDRRIKKEIERYEKEAKKREEESERREKEFEREAKKREKESERREKEFEREAKKREKESEQRAKEFEREAKKREEEFERETKRREKEMHRHKRETDRRIKQLDELFTSQWGKLMESLIKGDLINLLDDKGIHVNEILHNEERKGTYEDRQWEFDIVAIDGKELVVVEVKTTMKIKHVDHFIQKLERFTKLRPRFKGYNVYGAMAYLKADEDSDIYTEKNGLFVIRATGSSSSIINKKDFKPKVFH